MSVPFVPRDHAEAIAHFRLAVIGELTSRDLNRGELAEGLQRLASRRYRPPGAKTTRTFGASTIERWFYAYKSNGIAGLMPAPRGDRGPGRALTPELRELLLDIRRENPSVQTPLILATLIDDGRLESGTLSVATLNRLYRSESLDRYALKTLGGRQRLRWEAGAPGIFWHADVCHGPTIRIGDKDRKIRIHALLDDNSRYILAIWAFHTELEMDMLELVVRAIRRHGAPTTLYLDNGATYRGKRLHQICARLDVNVLHARPYDPQARGKMERFWRTLRGGVLNHLGAVTSLHDINVRLWAFVDERYHRAPHAGLLGRSPEQRWTLAKTRRLTEARIHDAYTVRVRRRVRRDSTLTLEGATWELDQSFLAGKVVTVARTLVVSDAPPAVEHGGHQYPLKRVDVTANGATHRKPAAHVKPTKTRAFDPAKTLLDRATGKAPRTQKEHKS